MAGVELFESICLARVRQVSPPTPNHSFYVQLLVNYSRARSIRITSRYHVISTNWLAIIYTLNPRTDRTRSILKFGFVRNNKTFLENAYSSLLSTQTGIRTRHSNTRTRIQTQTNTYYRPVCRFVHVYRKGFTKRNGQTYYLYMSIIMYCISIEQWSL